MITAKQEATSTQDTSEKRKVETFKHAPIDDSKSQLRLLELQPGAGHDDVVCKLLIRDRVASPDPNLSFLALSLASAPAAGTTHSAF